LHCSRSLAFKFGKHIFSCILANSTSVSNSEKFSVIHDILIKNGEMLLEKKILCYDSWFFYNIGYFTPPLKLKGVHYYAKLILSSCCQNTREVRGGTTEKGLMFVGSPRDNFYRKQLLFSFKKLNKQSAYGHGMAGKKEKYENRHTTVNVWI